MIPVILSKLMKPSRSSEAAVNEYFQIIRLFHLLQNLNNTNFIDPWWKLKSAKYNFNAATTFRTIHQVVAI